MQKSISKIISKDTVSSVERWQCPIVNDESSKEGVGMSLLTADKIEKIRRQAFKLGYEDGYKKGLGAGEQEGQRRVQPRLDVAECLINNLTAPLASLSVEVQQQLVSLAVLLTKQLVRREIKQDPGQIVAVVRDAVSLLPIATNRLQVRVHPEDHKVLLDVFKTSTDADHWQLLEDITLQRGDCIVNTEFSSIDATMETRLTAMLTEVLGSERMADSDDAEQTDGSSGDI